MADIKSPEARSKNMAAIKKRDTKPEIYLRKALFARGYRYRITPSTVPGHPDIYLAKYRLAIFVHGCFWHRHEGCRYSYVPKSRIEFWSEKFKKNISRDQAVVQMLSEQEYRCLIVWECAINQSRRKVWSSDSLLDAIVDFINSDKSYGEISTDKILPL
jgi:DNA mismatch endonuclease (patch repair protein)